jgi:RNA polymerase sigma factor (sigma-70 family)
MEHAFLKAIHDHQKIISKVCRIYRNRREDQQDLFQEIVYQLWKSYPSFKGEAKISTWMYRVALNTSMAIYRKQTLPLDYRDEFGEHLHPSSSEAVVSENEERLFLALRTLNDADKAVISLFLEDFNYQEIAEITGLSESNVGVRLNRIKNKLKKILH